MVSKKKRKSTNRCENDVGGISDVKVNLRRNSRTSTNSTLSPAESLVSLNSDVICLDDVDDDEEKIQDTRFQISNSNSLVSGPSDNDISELNDKENIKSGIKTLAQKLSYKKTTHDRKIIPSIDNSDTKENKPSTGKPTRKTKSVLSQFKRNPGKNQEEIQTTLKKPKKTSARRSSRNSNASSISTTESLISLIDDDIDLEIKENIPIEIKTLAQKLSDKKAESDRNNTLCSVNSEINDCIENKATLKTKRRTLSSHSQLKRKNKKLCDDDNSPTKKHNSGSDSPTSEIKDVKSKASAATKKTARSQNDKSYTNVKLKKEANDKKNADKKVSSKRKSAFQENSDTKSDSICNESTLSSN